MFLAFPITGELSAAGVLELAWTMGLIEWDAQSAQWTVRDERSRAALPG